MAPTAVEQLATLLRGILPEEPAPRDFALRMRLQQRNLCAEKTTTVVDRALSALSPLTYGWDAGKDAVCGLRA